MSTLIAALIQALWPSFKSQQDIDEEYLAQSSDLYDLERRMREIEQRSRAGQTAQAFGLGER
ncbi:MAG: DUF3563 family protein [Curvibacter sp.]|nr:DUF3563 family protein [Curvibacter sp.]